MFLFQNLPLLGIEFIFFFTAAVYILSMRKKYELEKEAFQSKQENQLRRIERMLQQKSKELTVLSLKLIEKEEQLTEFKQRIKSTNKDLNHKELNQIVNSITVSSALNWEEFDALFLELDSSFIKKLSENYPQLTQRDLRLCSLIKLNFSSKEIAQLSGVSVESIHTSRYRLRKKLKLRRKNKLVDFIVNV